MTMQQASVQVVSVALVQCKLHTILNRMVKAAQLTLGGFLCVKNTQYIRYTIVNPKAYCLYSVVLYRRLTMEILKENIITVEDIKAEIEKTKFEVPRKDVSFENCHNQLPFKWEVKGLKSRKDEIIEAFKDLDVFDKYIESNFESKENFEFFVINEIKLCMEELLDGFHAVGRPMIIPCIKS